MSSIQSCFVPVSLRFKEGDTKCTKVGKFCLIPFAALPYAIYKIASVALNVLEKLCSCCKKKSPAAPPVSNNSQKDEILAPAINRLLSKTSSAEGAGKQPPSPQDSLETPSSTSSGDHLEGLPTSPPLSLASGKLSAPGQQPKKEPRSRSASQGSHDYVHPQMEGHPKGVTQLKMV